MQTQSESYYSLSAVKSRLTQLPVRKSATHRHANRKKHEIIASIAVIFGMFALFGFVKPSDNMTTPTFSQLMSESYDFRANFDQKHTLKRSGRTTLDVGGEDVLVVLGADPKRAEMAIESLRVAGFLGLAELDSNFLLNAYFEDVGAQGEKELVAISYKPNPRQTILSTRRSDGSFSAYQLNAQFSTKYQYISGEIRSHLTDAVIEAGGTAEHARALAAAFPDDPQIYRGGRKGERFEIIYEVFEDAHGNFIEPGDLVFAAYAGKRANGEWYRYTPADTNRAEFFTEDGQAARLFLSRKPVESSHHITSGFGMRTHPIGGYEHLHTGVDYSAPMNTHVFSAGNGIVKEVSFRPGYGRYMRIQHANGYETAYAHLSGFDRTMYAGKRVKRGDLIGFVGKSGGVTGPHLHFEVRRNGSFVNPLTVALPTGRNLNNKPDLIRAFVEYRESIDQVRPQVKSTRLSETNYEMGNTMRASLATP